MSEQNFAADEPWPEPEQAWPQRESFGAPVPQWTPQDFASVDPLHEGQFRELMSSAFGVKGLDPGTERRVMEKFVRQGVWMPAPSGWLFLLFLLVGAALVPVAWVGAQAWLSPVGALPTSPLEPVRLLGRPAHLPRTALLVVCCFLVVFHFYALSGSLRGRRGGLVAARILFLCWGALFAVLAFAPYVAGASPGPVWLDAGMALLALGAAGLTGLPRLRRWCRHPGFLVRQRRLRDVRAQWD